jgi:hypothetical protein
MKVADFFAKPKNQWVNFGNGSSNQYCLGQALHKLYGSNSRAYEKAKARARELLGWDKKRIGNAIFDWNDAPHRTLEDVIALCKELGI